MADSREFVLIGRFDDQITGSLEKINNSLANLKRTFAGLSSKRGGYGDITKSVGSLVSSQKHLANSVKEVKEAVSDSIPILRQYKKELGGIAGAHFAIARATGQAARNESQFWNQATRSAQNYKRVADGMKGVKPARFSSPGAPRTPRTNTMPGGGGGNRGGGGGHGGDWGGNNFHMGAFAFGQELGQGLSQPLQTAIFSGFQMGVGLMAKTMDYVQGAFAERVKDQMSDLQAAGGFYAISKRQKNPMFTSLQTAIQFTQENNQIMARMAADLPGATQDYVDVSKRLGDSVMRISDSNEKGSLAYARELMTKGNLQESYKGVNLEGPRAKEGAIQVILGELTKKTVLAGFGGSTGRGGAKGAYGLPALMERLITNPDTTTAQLSRYAAVFGDPKIMNSIDRFMPELEKAGGDLLKRAQIVNTMMDDMVPPEMIAAMRKSLAGIGEAYRSAFIDPETGLFGFGRKIGEATEPMTNAFGQFVRIVEKNGKKIEEVVKTAGEADKISLSVFDMFSDILANYGSVLKPIVDNLYLLWDPMMGLKDVLADARIISTQVLGAFKEYNEALADYAKGIGDEDLRNKFLSTRSLRATLLTIGEIFNDLGILGDSQFQSMAKQITDKNAGLPELGKILSSTIQTFLNSDAAYNAGKFVGELLNAIVTSLSDMTGFASTLGTSKIAAGFMKGFGEDGVKKLQKIFTDIYTLIFNAIKSIIPLIPWQVYAFAAISVFLPAAVAGLAMALANGITIMVTKMGKFALAQLTKKSAVKSSSFTGPLSTRAVPGSGGLKFESYTPEAPALRKPGRFTRAKRAATGGSKSVLGRHFGSLKRALASVSRLDDIMTNPNKSLLGSLGDVAKGAGSGAKNLIPKGAGMLGKGGGILTAGTGIVEALISLFKGESLGTAIGKGAGPVLGTIIGTALLGPIGSILGGMIGSMEEVTGPLGDAASAIIGTLETTFAFLGQIGGDLLGLVNGLVKLIPGVSDGFNLLEFALFALLSPFKLLEIAINGLYDLYLTIKSKLPGGLNEDEQKRLDERNTVRLTDELTIQGRRRSGFSLEQQKADEYVKFKAAEKKGDTGAMNRSAEYMKSINKMLAEGGSGNLNKPAAAGGATTSKPTKGVDAALRALGGDPAKKLNLPTVTGAGGTTNIPQDLQKTAKTPDAVKTGTDKTTTAVKELTAKITSQSSLQTSVAAIYNLLASGMLRVQTNMAGMMMPGVRGLPTPITGIGTGQIPGVENIQWGATQKTNIVDTRKMNTQGNRGASNGDIAINSPVTIYQQPGQSTDELASIVAMKIGEAVADARAASVFV